jgi:hypothetical protein
VLYHTVKKIFLGCVICCFTIACQHEFPEVSEEPPIRVIPCPTDDLVHFENDIRPILTSSCAIPGCHDDLTPTALVNLSSYEAVMSTKVRGELIVKPGDSENSILNRSLRSQDIIVPMPPPFNYQISLQQKNLIKKWIDQGALNSSPCVDVTCDTLKFDWSTTIRPIIKTYCNGCHYGDYSLGEVELSFYSQVQEIALNGDLLDAIRGQNDIRLMPTDKPLPECKIIQITKWVENGAPRD